MGIDRTLDSPAAQEDLATGFPEGDGPGPARAAALEAVTPGRQIGPYTVLEFLGAGGMGQVYRARDKRLDRHVAIKLLRRAVADDLAAPDRFEREARAASALNHPNICTIYDIGEFEGRSFIVMELLEGQSLQERIGGRPVPLPEFFDIAQQICAALRAAHSKGIVHRDIKPANIFVTDGGQAKLVDFGLAKRCVEPPSLAGGQRALDRSTRSLSLTAVGTIVGTLSYMSPEQAVNGDVDSRSDVFSLGVVLYEMLTGQPPFRGESPADIIQTILTGAPPQPSVLNASIPHKLDGVILRALEKDRELRYQSVEDLSGDLEAWHQSGAAARTVRTRRWMLATMGLGAASLAGGAFLSRRSLFGADRRIMVAVLPLENIGGNAQDAFLAEGLHQDMISVLNRLYPDDLGVIGRTSVKRYQAGVSIEQIGRDLNVEYVVEGGVQRDGDQARVSARLIRVQDQTMLWSATYDRELGQVLAAQSEIAQAIAQGIERGLRPNVKVSAALARPLNASAHEAYLRGDYAKAVAIDPGYAAAFSGLANQLYYPGLFGFRPPRQAFSSMLQAASKALELDSTQASAHASRALGNLHLQWSWSQAEEGFRRALRLNPSDSNTRHFFAHFLLWSGRLEESAQECEYALNVDPFDPGLISCLGFHYLQAGDDAKALEATLRALALEPNHFWGLLTIGAIYEQKGMYQEALAAFRKTKPDTTLKSASIAHAFARSGNRQAAESILAELLAQSKTRYVSPYDIAVIHAGLDDKEGALESLNHAYEEHSGFLIFANSDPRLRSLRPDPRFQDLLVRMRYPNLKA